MLLLRRILTLVFFHAVSAQDHEHLSMVLSKAAATTADAATNGDTFLLGKSKVDRSPDDTDGTQMGRALFLENENQSHKENVNDLLLNANRWLSSSSEEGALGKFAKTEKVKPTKATQIRKKTERTRKTAKAAKKAKAGKAGKKSSKCNPETDVVLSDYQQWEDETGYWIGEYSFYQGDGTPYVSSSWPYPYDSYKGFITGNVSGNKYRQRNVFLYPPIDDSECAGLVPNDVVGSGECGVNGNTKIFEADQEATTCDGGNISGPYGSGIVFFKESEPRLLQSQLTTITKSPTGEIRRTRSAQGFNAFSFDGTQHTTNSMSYYRERKVTKEEFYAAFATAQSAYNILDADLCKWDNNGADLMGGGDGSMDACVAHLEESFAL